jgi:hypothetical protein
MLTPAPLLHSTVHLSLHIEFCADRLSAITILRTAALTAVPRCLSTEFGDDNANHPQRVKLTVFS